MQINIAIKNTIIVIRVKEVCEFVKYHSDNVGKNLTTSSIKGKSLRSPLKAG